MGKQSCCFCDKELGMLSNKFGKSQLGKYQNDIQVMEMSDKDVICLDCKMILDDPKNKDDLKLNRRVADYKKNWNKRGIIQFKNEHFAILQRTWGYQVQFIVAFDDLTKEGYRLMAIDEGKEGGQASGGFTGGVNAYFYFQKMEYVR